MAERISERQSGPQYRLIGKNYVTADLYAKVTGRSKYAEDFRAEGMLFCKLLLSPLPHATVIKASKWGERGLTMEPVYQGEPILAVAAVDELTAAEAVERIQIDFEPLPFVLEPLESLRPGGPNPRMEGNMWIEPPPAASGGPPSPPPTIG